jgi:flavin reductase (DIM6/NTAB) family NADH-FMN oxidoreductase RutF
MSPDAADAAAAGDASPEDRLRRRVLWKMPSGLYLLGSRAGDRRNLMTLNWATQVALHPKLVGVSVETTAFTHQLIEDGGVFALSILKRSDRAVVRKFVKPVDPADIDVDETGAGTMRELRVRADVTGAPILADAAAWIDCRVTVSVPVGSHSLFVGEVLGSGFTVDGEQAEVLRMEDTRMNYGG